MAICINVGSAVEIIAVWLGTERDMENLRRVNFDGIVVIWLDSYSRLSVPQYAIIWKEGFSLE